MVAAGRHTWTPPHSPPNGAGEPFPHLSGRTIKVTLSIATSGITFPARMLRLALVPRVPPCGALRGGAHGSLTCGRHLPWPRMPAWRLRHRLTCSTSRRGNTELLRRADVTRLGELVLFTEAAFLALRPRPSGGLDGGTAGAPADGDQARGGAAGVSDLVTEFNSLTLLFHQGIRRVGDLLGLTDAALRTLPGMSATDVDDVQRALARYGLQLHE